MSKNEAKRSKGVIFLTIFLNLTGFSIILPLSPGLLGYYLPNQVEAGGLLGQFVSTANALASAVGQENSEFMTAVFFGCLLASLYAFLQFLCSPLWGMLSDKLGRRPVLLMTMVGTGISYLMWIIADTFGLFILSRVIAGVMAGNLSVATAAVADVTEEKNRTKGMALVGVAFGLGFLVGPAIGGLLTQVNLTEYWPHLAEVGVNPFSMPALVAAGLAILNVTWIWLAFRETLPKSKRDNLERVSLVRALQEQTPKIRNTNLSYFIFLLTFSGLEFTLAFLGTERFNYGPVDLGYLFLYIGFILIFTQGYVIRKIAGIVRERHMAMIGFGCGILSFNMIALSGSEWMFYVGSTFLAASIAFTTPSLSGLVSLYATERTQGRFIGLFRSAGSLARALGPLVAAFPYFYYGSTVAYVMVSGLLLIPLVIVSRLPEPTQLSGRHEANTDPELLKEEEAPTI